jgi:hypothetical protein
LSNNETERKMPNIGTLKVGRELTHEEVDMVAGGLMTRGSDAQWDVKEGFRDLSHGNPEGWLDIAEGILDASTRRVAVS